MSVSGHWKTSQHRQSRKGIGWVGLSHDYLHDVDEGWWALSRPGGQYGEGSVVALVA